MLPQKFKQRYKQIIPDFEKFLEYARKPQNVSIRINTLKVSRDKFLEDTQLELEQLEQVPWYENAFFVKGKQAYYIGNTLEYFLGHVYLQDAASMIPPLVLEPSEKDRVLDLTAAPGSKTTQIAQLMKNKGCIVANDNSFERIKALRNNINRLGVLNVLITRMYVSDFSASQNGKFDRVLLDAPCSLEGSMRKYFINWNENIIHHFANTQRKMLLKAFELTNPGGILVYSTCTYAPEENEGVVQSLLNQNERAKLEQIKLPGLKAHQGLVKFRDTSYDSELKKTIRLYTHDYNTGGFFIAKIRKDG